MIQGILLKARKDSKTAAILANRLAVLREDHRDAILPVTTPAPEASF